MACEIHNPLVVSARRTVQDSDAALDCRGKVIKLIIMSATRTGGEVEAHMPRICHLWDVTDWTLGYHFSSPPIVVTQIQQGPLGGAKEESLKLHPGGPLPTSVKRGILDAFTGSKSD